MEEGVHSIQTEVVNKIILAYDGPEKNACIHLISGMGIARIMTRVIREMWKREAKFRAFVLFQTRVEVEQFASALLRCSDNISFVKSIKNYEGHVVLLTTYHDYLINNGILEESTFNLIICWGAESLDSTRYCSLLQLKCGLRLGVFEIPEISDKNVFRGMPFIYMLSFNEALEKRICKELIVPMLKHMRYSEIKLGESVEENGSGYCPDIMAVKDGYKYFIELKIYRGPNNDVSVIKNAICQMKRYRDNISTFTYNRYGIIFLCIVDEKIVEEIREVYGIFAWDIRNLLYVCAESDVLSEKLQQLMPYSINGIQMICPPSYEGSGQGLIRGRIQEMSATKLISRLKKCATGNSGRADKAYEKICEDIIQYLFENEFNLFSVQNTTNDAMFKMDILCSLKGTTAFWNFLMTYYNTKFVVFECKNYCRKIDQNLVYITDKYLFSPALRNVAFIISREGFQENAQKAALGILKEQGKLIVDLTDADLEKMIYDKVAGKEPSDYLLEKVERMLMGVSI